MFTLIKTFLGPVWSFVATGGAILAIVGGIYAKGHIDGTRSMKAKWDAAIARSLADEAKARKDAEKEINADPNGGKHDPNNRDN